MHETTVENNIIRQCRRKGGEAYKFKSPQMSHVPDRLCLLPVAEEHRAIVAQYVFFIEAKRPGEAPRPAQEMRMDEMRKMGFKAFAVDDPKWKLS